MTNLKNIQTYIKENGNEACHQCGYYVTETTDRNAPCPKCVEHAAKREQERLDQLAASAKLCVDLVSIERTAVKKGFQFVGTFADGHTMTLRAVATRPYTVAAIHARSVVSKFDMPDVRGFVTFHNASPKPAGSWDQIIKVIPINEGGAA